MWIWKLISTEGHACTKLWQPTQHRCSTAACIATYMNVNKITVCHGVCACAFNTVTRCVVISKLVMPWMFSLPTLADRLTLLHITHLHICRVGPTIYTHVLTDLEDCDHLPHSADEPTTLSCACTQAYCLAQHHNDETFLYHQSGFNIYSMYIYIMLQVSNVRKYVYCLAQYHFYILYH